VRAPCYCTQRRLRAQIFGRTFISTNHPPLRDAYRRETDRGNRRLMRNIIIYIMPRRVHKPTLTAAVEVML